MPRRLFTLSIIYDALQKTQKKRLNQDAAPQPNPNLNPNPIKNRPMSYATYIILINTLLIICLLAFSRIYNSFYIPQVSPPPPPPAIQHRVIQPEKPKLPAKDKYVLSGMFISKDEKLVVINNKTLHEGDKIDDAKIIRIQPNKVILTQNGLMFALKSELG